MKTHYELLGVAASAPPDQIRSAYRREVARYHPDKVAHLGPELQQLAALRTSELSSAYHVLIHADRRVEYDLHLQQNSAAAAGRSSADQASPGPAHARDASHAQPPRSSMRDPRGAGVHEGFLKRASLQHLREAAEQAGELQEFPASGFDFAAHVRSRRGLFQRAGAAMTLLARVVASVDGSAVEETWRMAARVAPLPGTMVGILLLGLGLAPQEELASAIAHQRQRRRPGAPPMVLAPVDVRDWRILVPADAAPELKALLDKLRDPRH